MIKNRIPITLTDERQRVTGPTVSYRYDAVQYLVISGVELPDAYAVDFCNLGDETTTPIVGGADGVRIPNKYLRTGKTIIAYLIITGDDENAVETRYEITLPVRSRPKRGELDPTEDEREEIDILVDRLNEAAVEAEEQATAAAASADSASEDAGKAEAAVTHYPKIVDRYWYVWDAEHETWTNTGIKAEGVDGTDGVGIQSMAWNADYTMTITMTNGTVYTSISLRGEVGATPNFTIGTVTTGAAGSQASATITGTPERPVLNLTIPRGDTGEVSQDDLDEALRPLNQAITDLDGQVNDTTTGLDTKAPAIINTASGAIASFADGADSMPVKKLVVSIEPVQAGTGDPSPDNERPITGWTGAKIEQGNQNYVDTAATGKSFNTTGVDTDVSGMYATEYIPVSTGEILLYKFTSASGAMTRRVCLYDAQKVFVSMPYNATWVTVGKTEERKITIPDGVAYARTTGPTSDRNKMTCAKYSATTVTFPSEAETVYGGTVTYNGDGTWTLENTYNYKLYDGSADEDWTKDSSYNRYTLPAGTIWYHPSARNELISNIGKFGTGNAIGTIFIASNGRIYYYAPTEVNTLALFREFLAETNLQICGRRNAPLTYTITTEQLLKTLHGTNNIWADCGDSTVEYTADTKLYIEQLTQPTEDDMTANANIAANTFFMIGNTLYFSTAAISAGEAIVPGTNCNLVSLADALNQLNA